MQFGRKNSYKEFVYSKPVIIILFAIIVFLSMSVYERFGVERDMSQRKVSSEEELQKLQERKAQLKDRVDYLEGDRGIEEEIRKNFDVAKEGEKVIILVGDDEVLENINNEEVQKYPWYQFWR